MTQAATTIENGALALAVAGIDPHGRMDELEALLSQLPPVDCPTVHRFTPGLYSREIFMPAGTLVTSKIHKTEHQFIISRGRVRVRNIVDGEWIELAAPYHGITPAGTRRVLQVLDDTVWTTLHVTDLTDVEAIEREIIDIRTDHLMPEAVRDAYGVARCHVLPPGGI